MLARPLCRSLLPFAALFLPLAAASSQDGSVARGLDPAKALTQFRLDVWREEHGLPQNTVNRIAQGPEGYLWLATMEGLVRFDGVRFTVFDRTSMPALGNNFASAVVVDGQGTLWVGTHGAGVVRIRDGVHTVFSTANGLSSDYVRELYSDRDGRIWVASAGTGVSVLDGDKISVYTTANGLPHDFVTRVAQDRDGVIWIATRAGLARLRDGVFTTYSTQQGLPHDNVTALSAARDGSLWVGTGGGGLARLRNGRFTIHGERDGLSSRFVMDLLEDSRGTLWIGTNGGGLNRLRDGRFSVLTTQQGLPSDLVWSLHEDREGSLWLGTNGGGLNRLQDAKFTVYGAKEGLSSDVATALHQDRDGTFWFGTARGLNRYRDGAIRTFTTDHGLGHNVVTAIGEDRTGGLWVGTPGGGLTLFRNGRLVTTYTTRHGLAHNNINAILEDGRGHLWVATNGGGLQRWRPGPPALYTTRDGLASDFVFALARDSVGGLWIGTRDGLSRMHDGRLITFTAKDGLPSRKLEVSVIYVDPQGMVWIGTRYHGLSRLRNGRFTNFSRREGLFDDAIHHITEDDSGNLWMSSNKGIFRVARQDFDDVEAGRRQQLRSVAYGTADGLRSREANGGIQPAGWKRADGTLWFPTMGGVASIDPRRIRINMLRPPVVIEQVLANDRPVPMTATIALPAGSQKLEFHFTALSFLAPERMAFRYRLDNFDGDWVEAGTRRTAYYTNVPPGHYRFRVQAANSDGIWNDTGAGVDIVLAPHFHETWIFYLLCALALGTLVTAGYRVRVSRLKTHARELMMLVAERTRAEERYRELFENAIDAVFTTDHAGFFTALNKRAEEITGYSRDEARRLNIAQLLSPGEGVGTIGRLEPTTLHEVEIVAKSGARIPLEISTRVIYENGEAVGVQGIARDIRERKSLEAQLRQAQKMEAIGRLTGGVAHDFNNLLTAILGNCSFLLKGMGRDDPHRDEIDQIQEAAERAASLTRQMLAFSRKQHLAPQVVSLNILVLSMDQMLRRLIGEHIQLATVLQPALWPVRADPSQIEQVILNLVLNARDAMPDGGRIRIETANVERSSPVTTEHAAVPAGAYAVLSVIDTGTGIAPEEMPHIFEPFFTTKEQGKGTGLGLSTVYGIVTQSGGAIEVDSRPGHGTRFRIYLPRTQEPAPVSSGAATPPSATKAVPGGATVLVVEGDDAVRALACRALARAGHAALGAAHAVEALQTAASHQGAIDVVVLDATLPGTSGPELFARLRMLHGGLRALFMIAESEIDQPALDLLAGQAELQRKPLTPELLVRRVDALAARPAGSP